MNAAEQSRVEKAIAAFARGEIVVVTDDDPKRAETLACDLATACWNERHAFMETELVPIAEAIELEPAEPTGPGVDSD